MDTPLNIVVIEDNEDLREAIAEVLSGLGHRLVTLSCAEELGDEGAHAKIDLLVLDLNLPGEDGISLAGRLRSVQPGLSILMLTARAAVRDKVLGYEAGADIYLTKPASIEEIIAAVRALSRRHQAKGSQPANQPVLFVRVSEQQAHGPGGPAELSAIEVALLSALARAPDQRLAYWQLLEIMTTSLEHASRANLAVRMTRLRKKISDAGFDGPILQVFRHEGYQLRVAVELI